MDAFDFEGWRCVKNADSQETTYRRPLGMTECGFYWDTVSNGIAITLNHLELEAEEGLEHDLFSKDNLELAWIRLKQRFPLLGASTEVTSSGRVEFVLSEERLRSIRPGEFNFILDRESSADAERFSEELKNGVPMLDDTFLARVWVIPKLDAPRRCHVYIPIVHSITDGMGNATVTREYCQELASLSKETNAVAVPLVTRLQQLLPVEALTLSAKLSLPRRRWRLAIASVIRGIQQAKTTGGHTLPAQPTITLGKPVRSCTQRSRLSPSDSKAVMTGCRALGITFGNALPVLSQVAVSRVLHRLRAKGQITDEDWEYRRKQPMHFTGPINYRPYLDSAWYAAGGVDEVMMAISFSTLTLPFMPTSSVADSTGAPPFAALLSPARFLARAQMATVRGQQLLRHPLIHEFHALRLPDRNKRTKTAALAWRAAQKGEEPPEGAEMARKPGQFSNIAPCIFTNGGASLGNRDHLIPHDYPYPLPLSPGAAAPPVRFRLKITHDLRCRPGELYLGASTTRGQLSFFSHIDANSFDPGMVLEWMEEVKDAALFYLGQIKREQIQQAKL